MTEVKAAIPEKGDEPLDLSIMDARLSKDEDVQILVGTELAAAVASYRDQGDILSCGKVPLEKICQDTIHVSGVGTDNLERILACAVLLKRRLEVTGHGSPGLLDNGWRFRHRMERRLSS